MGRTIGCEALCAEHQRILLIRRALSRREASSTTMSSAGSPLGRLVRVSHPCPMSRADPSSFSILPESGSCMACSATISTRKCYFSQMVGRCCFQEVVIIVLPQKKCSRIVAEGIPILHNMHKLQEGPE